MDTNLTLPKGGKLAKRLIILIVLFSTAIALIATAYQLYKQYEQDVSAIDGRFAQVEGSYLSSIIENTWLIDVDRLKILLDGIKRLPDFQHASVTSNDGTVLAKSGVFIEANSIIRNYDLTYTYRGQPRRIGTLTVSASLDAAVQRTLQRAWLILVSNGLKTFLVAIFIYIIVRQLITRHMEKMGRYAREFSMDNLSTPLVLDRAPLSGDDDELGNLVDSINAMRENLKQSYDSLRTLNLELEARVADRTRELAREKERAENYLSTARTMIVALSSNGEITLINDKGCEVLGYDRKDILRRDWFSLAIPPDIQLEVKNAFNQIMAGNLEPVEDFENDVITSTGERRIISWHNNYLRDENGRITGTLGAGEDITAQRQAELALRESEHRFRDIASAASDWFWETGADNRFIYVSGKGPETLGINPEDIIGMTRLEILRRDEIEIDPSVLDAHIQDIINQRPFRGLEYQIVLGDGNPTYVSVNGQPVFSETGAFKGYRGTAHDITERITSIKEIEKLSLHNKLVLDTAADGIYGIDMDGNATFANPAALNTLGWTIEELIGKSHHDLTHHTQADGTQYPREESPVSAALRGSTVHQVDSETFWRKDGSSFPVEYSSNPIIVNDQTIGAVVTFRDITDRLEAEIQIQHARKMDSLGNMAGGIAHTLNNLLLPIMALTKMTADGLPKDSDDRHTLGKVMQASERAKELVARVLTFSRMSGGSPVIVNTYDITHQSVGLLQSAMPGNIELKLDLDADTGSIFADPSDIETIIVNLVTNASAAIDGANGEIGISLCRIDADAELKQEVSEITFGPHAKITISDNGPGIPEKVQERIFDPFFTTKEVGKGTGLGLSMVHGSIRDHNGAIHIDSTPGKGTVIDVYIPLTEQDPMAPALTH